MTEEQGRVLRTNMSSLVFTLKKTQIKQEIYILDEIRHNDLMSEKYCKTCKYLNYVEHMLILVPAVTVWASISVFASLVCIFVGIASSAVVLSNTLYKFGSYLSRTTYQRNSWAHAYFSFSSYCVGFNFCICFIICVPVGIASCAVGLWNTLYKYGSYLSGTTSQRNGIETIVDNYGILRLN